MLKLEHDQVNQNATLEALLRIHIIIHDTINL